MKGEKLLDLIGEIDDKFIEEFNMESKRKTNYKYFALAASIFLLIGISLAINRMGETSVITSEGPGREVVRDILPDENLPKLSINEVFSDGMGYSGVTIKDITDLENGNPWREDWNLSSLPVYKNEFGFTKGFINDRYTIDEMKAEIRRVAKYFNIEFSDSEFIIIPYDEYEFSNVGFEGDRENIAGEVWAEKDGYTFKADRGGGVRVMLNDDTAIYTSTVLGISEGYDMDEVKVKRLNEYLLKEYEHLIPFENPVAAINRRTYGFDGSRNVNSFFYGNEDDAVSRFLSYHLEPRVQFILNPLGNVYMIDYDSSQTGELIGNYPLITKDEAVAAMKEGSFITNVPFEFPGVEYIRKTELTYLKSPYQDTLIPYYLMYVELPEEVRKPGFTPLGMYYVPAIEAEFIEDMNLYEGQFN